MTNFLNEIEGGVQICGEAGCVSTRVEAGGVPTREEASMLDGTLEKTKKAFRGLLQMKYTSLWKEITSFTSLKFHSRVLGVGQKMKLGGVIKYLISGTVDNKPRGRPPQLSTWC